MLVILHISWRQHTVIVWGERTASPCRLHPRAQGAVQVRLSPFDAGAEILGGILKGFLWETADLQMSHLDLRLPTGQMHDGPFPVPSQPFLLSAEVSVSPPLSLDTWQVTAAELTWKQAFTLLGVCRERRLADGVFAGEDLLAFAHLFRFAAVDLVYLDQGKEFFPLFGWTYRALHHIARLQSE